MTPHSCSGEMQKSSERSASVGLGNDEALSR